ncbi:MAG TPA: hypothetical protein QF873_02700 [Patescibacteria group bacterium]|nr:hypothetical protein [Patescibacteria group bacterium]
MSEFSSPQPSERFEAPRVEDLRRREVAVEVDEISHGINLSDYGTEDVRDANVDLNVSVESTEVFVSSEHLSRPGDQRLPVDYVVYDEELAGVMPAGEVSWAYAEMPDGTVELEDMRTVARADGKEQRQWIHRAFRNDGTVSQEEVKVDGKLFKQRIYADDGHEGEMVYDDFFGLDGKVERRVVYYQNEGESSWHSYVTIINGDDDRLEKVEGSLNGPPALKGIPQLNEYLDPPALAYKNPHKRVDS